MLILPLNDQHDRQGFDCGSPVLNGWFQQMARQHKSKGISSTFVVVADKAGTEVYGFYSLSFAEIINVDLPVKIGKKLPVKVPVFRLGRLATSEHHKRQGIGKMMVADAFLRVKQLADHVGGIGLMVNAKPEAVVFYRQYGFEQMRDHPLNLFMPF